MSAPSGCPDYEILKDTAVRLGFGDSFWENEEACLDFILEPMGLTFEGVFAGSERLNPDFLESFKLPY